jgi:hypothetical protein
LSTQAMCSNCKWWLGPDYEGWGDCELTDKERPRPTKAHVPYVDAWFAPDYLVTHHDFYCNQHEPKEKRIQPARAPNWDEDTVTIDLDEMFGRQGGSA